MFIFGITDYQGALTWNISLATYSGLSYNVGSQSTYPYYIYISTDGTKMYIGDYIANIIYEYSLSVAFNVSSASYVTSFSMSPTYGNNPVGIFFSPDGTKMYINAQSNSTVSQYTLATAWNISTASYSSGKLYSAQTASSYGMTISADGTKLYVNANSGTVYAYTMSTAYSISTASYSTSYSVASQSTNITGIRFSTDGTHMYVSNQGDGKIYQYNLATAWDVSTAVYYTLLATGYTSLYEFTFSSDGTKMYLTNAYTDKKVYEFYMH
jgi:sugar lactone lactonase YvrE